jgi:hypothetical protein
LEPIGSEEGAIASAQGMCVVSYGFLQSGTLAVILFSNGRNLMGRSLTPPEFLHFLPKMFDM